MDYNKEVAELIRYINSAVDEPDSEMIMLANRLIDAITYSIKAEVNKAIVTRDEE